MSPEPETSFVRPDGTPARILVVDDEAVLAELLGAALRHQGWQTRTASNGWEALDASEDFDPDLVVLDIQMPGLDGMDTLDRLRKRKPRLPVLFLTARDTTGDRVRGLDAGADDYLVKPFDLSELFARLRSLIRRTVDRPSPVIAIGKTSIDTRARTVAVEGKFIPLTAKEYMILEYLAQHRGKVITRTELYEHVFDERSDTLSNLLDVHVYNLRKKMACDFIATRRGHGYCIE